MNLNPVIKIVLNLNIYDLSVFVMRYNDRDTYLSYSFYNVNRKKLLDKIDECNNSDDLLSLLKPLFADIADIDDFFYSVPEISETYFQCKNKLVRFNFVCRLSSHQIGGITRKINKHLEELNNYCPSTSCVRG